IGRKNLDEIQRMSTGVGIEWVTPIGPLQLIFAKPINDKPGDNTNLFEFAIGTRF
ncbi:MAG: BamA/TamA family outer membrane protein, partial [Campylobacter sp.]|nr:BamA/TamA family outer membrane protein [Campylobacter sp.]